MQKVLSVFLFFSLILLTKNIMIEIKSSISLLSISKLVLLYAYSFIIYKELRQEFDKTFYISWIHSFFPLTLMFVIDVNIYNYSSLLLKYIGIYIVLYSIFLLKSNFSLTPIIPDKIVSKGLYRVIRHPIYFGNILLFSASIFEVETFQLQMINISLTSAYIALSVMRIKIEEKVLLKSKLYRQYTTETKKKLIPLIY